MTINFTDAQLTGHCQSSLVTYTDKYQNDKTFQVHQESLDDWQALVAAAKQDGIELAIASSYRSFERQLAIWNRKAIDGANLKNRHNEPLDIKDLSKEQILEAILNWSAVPGGSRHHWGCDMDVYCPSMLDKAGLTLQLEPWEYQAGGPMQELGIWLGNNLQRFGFYRPYQHDLGGVAIEPWHISHQKVSAIAQQQFSLSALSQAIDAADIGLKQLIIDNLEHIYKQYVINTEAP